MMLVHYNYKHIYFTIMNKKLLFSALLAIILPVLVSCDDSDDADDKKYEAPYALYVLNEGSWGKNNASISGIAPGNFEGQCDRDIYSDANGKALGDVAQDLVYDDDTHCLFVSVSESRYIAKLDDRGRELVRYATGDKGQPRSLELENGYLYVSMYGDAVAKFDTASLSLVASVKVGTYPEQMAIEDDMLAVCNSGWGNENTLSIIDLRTFSVVKTITLPHANPQHIIACNGRFYCNTSEYDENWNSVSNIVEVNTKDWSVKDITDGFYLTEGDDIVYIVKQEVDYSTIPYSYKNTFKTYNTKTGTLGNDFLSASNRETLVDEGIYSISYDDDTKTMYICVSQQEGAEYVNSTVMSYDARSNVNTGYAYTGVLAKKVVVAR